MFARSIETIPSTRRVINETIKDDPRKFEGINTIANQQGVISAWLSTREARLKKHWQRPKAVTRVCQS
jgi:hypothetical protein